MQQAAKKTEPRRRLAGIGDLGKISFLVFSTEVMPGFSILDQFVLNWFIAFCKLGYGGMKAPFEFIQGALVRVARSEKGKSRSVLYASFARLEAAGFIRRSRFRIGPDHFETEILFCEKLCGFVSHISLSVQNRDRIQTMSNRVSCIPTECFNNKPARAIDIVVDKPVLQTVRNDKKRDRAHPVIKSLQINARGKNRALVLARAFVEIFNPELRSSGIDWAAVLRSWPSRTFDERDRFCVEVLIPELSIKRPYALPELPELPEVAEVPEVPEVAEVLDSESKRILFAAVERIKKRVKAGLL